MRAAVVAGVLIFTASVAVASPFPQPTASPAIRLTLPEFVGRENTDTALIGSRARAPLAPRSGYFIDSLQIETMDDPRPGRRRQILQYRLQGVSVFGGAVGGSLGGQGTVLSLHWPTGQ